MDSSDPDGRFAGDSGAHRPDRSRHPNGRRVAVGRRRLLGAAGSALGVAIAGCIGGGAADYDHGGAVDLDGEPRSSEEMTAAEAVAEEEVREGVTPLAALDVADHAFVLENGFEGSTVQGRIENAGGDRLDLVEVRARVYDGAGDRLGRYLDRTGDLEAGEGWAFTIVVLESPADVARYEVAALGTPA